MGDTYTPPPREDLERWHNCLKDSTDQDGVLVAHDLAARLRLVPVSEVLENDATRHQQKMVLALRRLRALLGDHREGAAMIDALRDLVAMDPHFEASFAARQEANFDTFFPALIEDVFVHHIAGRYLGPVDMLHLERTSPRLAGTKFMDRAWAAVGARRFRDKRTGEVLPAFTALLTLADRVSGRNLVFWCNYVLQYTARCFSFYHWATTEPFPSYEDFPAGRPGSYRLTLSGKHASFVKLNDTQVGLDVVPLTLGLAFGQSTQHILRFWTQTYMKFDSTKPVEWFTRANRTYLACVPLGEIGPVDDAVQVKWNATAGRLESSAPKMGGLNRQHVFVTEPSVNSRSPLTGKIPKNYSLDFVPVGEAEPDVLYAFRIDRQIANGVASLDYVNWTALMRLYAKHGAEITPRVGASKRPAVDALAATQAWQRGKAAWRCFSRDLTILGHLRCAWFTDLALRLPQAGKGFANRKAAGLKEVTRLLILPMWRFFSGQTNALDSALVTQMAAGHPYQMLHEVIRWREKASCTYADNPDMYLI